MVDTGGGESWACDMPMLCGGDGWGVGASSKGDQRTHIELWIAPLTATQAPFWPFLVTGSLWSERVLITDALVLKAYMGPLKAPAPNPLLWPYQVGPCEGSQAEKSALHPV